MENKQIKKNIVLSVLVQIISLSVSFLLNIIVPKYISEYQYSYWQIYILYSSYVGVLHFGLLDGILLRYSQYDYDNIDKSKIRSQFQVLLFSITLIAVLLILFTNTYFDETVTKEILILLAVSIISKNIFTYNSYTFQITNRIKQYALMTLIQRVSYGVLVVCLLLFGVQGFMYFCIADLAGDFLGIIASSFFNKGMYFGKSLSIKETLSEWNLNIRAGISLMVANWSSFLLIGSAKMFIQAHWNELVFGKVSFSISVSNLFLSFISAVSIVLFPSLKRLDEKELPGLYVGIRNSISPLLIFSLVAYFPGSIFLKYYLPSYSESVEYLGILLPIIIYSSKVNLLTNNYFKAYRKEVYLLIINVVSILLAMFLFIFSTQTLNSVRAILLCVVLSCMFNSIVSECVISKFIGIDITKQYIIESVMTLGFIFSTQLFTQLHACLIYGLLLTWYFYVNRNSIMQVINKFNIKRLKSNQS